MLLLCLKYTILKRVQTRITITFKIMMMKPKTTLELSKMMLLSVCSFYLCTFSSVAIAQGTFKLHVGPSFPTADYADDDTNDNDAGGAGIGINAGIDYLYPITETGFYLFGGLDVNFHGLKADVKEDLEDQVGNADVTFYNYLNVPVSAGLYYEINASDELSLFGNAGLAYNFLKLTNFKVEEGNTELDQKYDLSTKLGYKIGAGIIINGQTTIGVNLFKMGEHDLDVEREITGQEDVRFDSERKISFVTLTVGFTLN